MKIYKIIITYLFTFYSLITLAQFDFSADTLFGCRILNVDFTVNPTEGITDIEWDFGNGLTSNILNPTNITYDSAGNYTVMAIINNTDPPIIKESYINLYTPPISNFIFSSDSTPGTFDFLFICQPQIYPNLSFSYIWDFDDGTINVQSDTSIAYHKYSEEGTYIVGLSVTNNIGCASMSTDTIVVYDSLKVPNIFTPNDDGRNDELIIKTNGRSAYLFHVFSRTGALIYKSESPIIVWHGKTNAGIKVGSGIYFYLIKEVSGSEIKTGFFYLIRENPGEL